MALGIAAPAPADPLNNSLLVGSSTAHFQDASSIFGNPAALAFQTELNGTELATSFLGSANRSVSGAFAVGLSLGYFGLGYERLSAAAGDYNRYSLALSAPLHRTLFFGTRLGLTRSAIAAIGSPDSVDLGLQFRPNSWVAIGLQANRVNEPTVAGVPLRTQWVAGAILRPRFAPRLEVTADVDTLSGSFAQRFGYQATVAYQPFDGFQIRAGYHDLYKAQIGIRFDFEQASMTAVTQPSSQERTFVFGLTSSLKSRPSVMEPGRALLVEFDSTLKEEPVEGSLFLPDTPSLWQKLRALDEAAARDDVDLVILRVEDFTLGLGPAFEVFDRVQKLRERKKTVVAFLENADAVDYLVASAADRIYVAPGSQFRFTGLAVSHLFLKGTLDKIGIEGEVFARGKYKSAPEMFTRKESSPEAKEVSFSLLADLERQIKARFAKSGRISEAKWEELKKAALLSAREALQAKLVDGIADYGTERDKLRSKYLVRESLERYRDRLDLPKRIAVVHASGNILKGGRGLLAFGGAAMTPEGMAKRLDAALADSRTAGIVVRVSSGGGEVGASYQIAGLIEEAAKKKPLAVSMGSVAASGGYLISAPAQRIFADESTLTGSIGVFLGKPNLAGLLKKIDLHLEILSNAPHAGLMSWDRPLTDEGRKVLLRQLNEYYEDFTRFVGKHRELGEAKVEAAAQGRVWTGSQAKERGLVDEIGGLDEAVAWTARKAGLGERDSREVTPSRGFFEFFEPGSLLKSASAESILLSLLPEQSRESLAWMASLKENPFLYLSPIHQIE